MYALQSWNKKVKTSRHNSHSYILLYSIYCSILSCYTICLIKCIPHIQYGFVLKHLSIYLSVYLDKMEVFDTKKAFSFPNQTDASCHHAVLLRKWLAHSPKDTSGLILHSSVSHFKPAVFSFFYDFCKMVSSLAVSVCSHGLEFW